LPGGAVSWLNEPVAVLLSNPLVGGYLAPSITPSMNLPKPLVNSKPNHVGHRPSFLFHPGKRQCHCCPTFGTPPDAIHPIFYPRSWLGDAPSNAPVASDVFRRLAQFFVNAQMPGYLRMRAACALVLGA